MKYVPLVQRLYLASGADTTATCTIRKQDALTEPAIPAVSTAVTEFKVLRVRSLSCPAMESDEEN